MNDMLYLPKQIEDKPLDRTVLIHKAMHYKCQHCGRIFRMWIEKGLEDESTGRDNHKPVPFSIACLCGYGIPHLRTDGSLISETDLTGEEIDSVTQMAKEATYYTPTGLETYSTTQLKNELRRRKRW